MLFYLCMFVAILIAALQARFIYAASTNKNGMVHTSDKRIVTTDNSRTYEKERTDFKLNNDLPIPPVHEGGLVSSNALKKHPVKPVVCQDQETTRQINEERLLSMYEAYKARRRANSEPLTLEMVSKPFRRKVAPWAKENKNATRPWKTQDCPVPVAEPTYSELTHHRSGPLPN